MNKKEKQQLKEKILLTIEETAKKIESMEANTKPIAPENSIGRVSRMDAINNKSVTEAALRTAKSKLSQLKLALSKIDRPEFGICARCGNKIAPARLMFMPESSRCIRCADK